MKTCEHLKNLEGEPKPKTKGCGECEKIGSTWVALRMCMTCGEVGCCDSSEHKHARKHFEETKHPIIKSVPITESSWKWCYIHDDYLDE